MSQQLSEFNSSYLSSNEIQQGFFLEIKDLFLLKEVAPYYNDEFNYDDLIRYDARTFKKKYDSNFIISSGCLKRTPIYNNEFSYNNGIVYDDFTDIEAQKCLIDLQGETSKTLSWNLRSAEASSTSIGAFKVEITDKDEFITQLFNPNLQGEIVGRVATFYGALDYNYGERIALHSGVITELKSKAGSVVVTISDANFIAKKVLFGFDENKLQSNISAASTTLTLQKNIPYPQTNGINFSLYIRINDEIMLVTNQVGTVLTVVRAQFGTFSVAHNADDEIKIQQRIYGNPFDIIVALLESDGTTGSLPLGAGIPSELIDYEKIEYIRDYILPSIPEFDAFIEDEIKVKDFIEKEILLPIGCYSLPKIGGKFSIGVLTPPLINERITLDCCNIVNPNKLSVERSLNRNFYNVVTYKFDKDQVDDKFTRGRIEIQQQSIDVIKYGEKYLDIEAPYYRGLDYDLFADYSADKILDRYSLGAEFIQGVGVQYRDGIRIDIGDVIMFEAEKLKMSEFKDGERVYKTKLMEVVNKSINFVTGECKLDLLNTAYSLKGRFGVISLSGSIYEVGANYVKINSIDSVDSRADWSIFIGSKVIIYSRNDDFGAFGDCIELTIQSVSGDAIYFVENPIDPAWATLVNYELVFSLSNYESANEYEKERFVYFSQTLPVNVVGSTVFFTGSPDLPNAHTLVIHDESWDTVSEHNIISKSGNIIVLKEAPLQQGACFATIGGMTSDDGLPYRYI